MAAILGHKYNLFLQPYIVFKLIIISACLVASKKKDFQNYSTQVTFCQGH